MLIAVALLPQPMFAQDVHETGRIVDPYDVPVSNASVQYYSGDRKLVDLATQVSLGGQLSAVLHGFNGAQVRVEITSPGYLLETRNVLIERDVASLGIIRLKTTRSWW